MEDGMSEPANLRTARAYLKALEDSRLGAEVATLFDEAIVFTEHPNRIKPAGATADRSRMTANSETGKSILRSQSYEIQNAVCDGDKVALQVLWKGVVDIPMGDLKPGDTMVCFSGMFLTFKDGKIIRQHNYDCFPPF